MLRAKAILELLPGATRAIVLEKEPIDPYPLALIGGRDTTHHLDGVQERAGLKGDAGREEVRGGDEVGRAHLREHPAGGRRRPCAALVVARAVAQDEAVARGGGYGVEGEAFVLLPEGELGRQSPSNSKKSFAVTAPLVTSATRRIMTALGRCIPLAYRSTVRACGVPMLRPNSAKDRPSLIR